MDIKQFLSKAGLTSESVDEVCSEEHILEISPLVFEWELVANHLGLEPSQIEEIKDVACSLQLKRLKTLKAWKSHFVSDATYRKLLETLLRIRGYDVAIKVCNLLNPKLDNENEASVSSGEASHEAEVVEPSSPQNQTGSRDCLEKMVQHFKDRWYELQMSALEEFEENNIPVEKFRHALIILPEEIKEENKEFIMSEYHTFKTAKSIEAIFLYLNSYLSFIDFSLLEHIINCFGSKSLKQEMKQYCSDMQKFRLETQVADIIPYIPKVREPLTQFVELHKKLDLDPKECTLEDLEQHRKEYGREFSLSKWTQYLVRLEVGCVEEICLIPSDIVPGLKDLIKKKSVHDNIFHKLKIQELSINGERLFPPTATSVDHDVLSQPVSTMMATESPTLTPKECTSSAQSLEVNIIKASSKELSKQDVIDTAKWACEGTQLSATQVDQEITLLTEVPPCKGVDQGVLTLEVTITYIRSGTDVKCTADLSPGQYLISFTPNKLQRGRYMISVKVNGIEIEGSPKSMFVKMPPQKLGDFVAKISDLKSPSGIACSNEGVLVCEIDRPRISRIDSSFRMAGVIAESDDLEAPIELSLDSESNMYVSTLDKIHKLNKKGEHLKVVGSHGSEDDQFNIPNGSCVWNDRLYVCDSRNNRIKVFDLELNHVYLTKGDQKREIGIIGHQCGEELGEFSHPSDLKFDKKGNMYVAEKLNNRVQVLSPEGKPIKAFNADGQLKCPSGLQVTDDYVFVTELDSNRVSVFNLDGKLITTFGDGYLKQPNGIAVDHDGFVYISSSAIDKENKLVYVF